MEHQNYLEKLTSGLKESMDRIQEYHNDLGKLRPIIQPVIQGKDLEPWIPTEENIKEIERLENLCKQEQERQRNILDVMYHLKKYRSD